MISDTIRLTFIRHATALEINEGVSDFDRPLTKKGLKQAHTLARFFNQTRLCPNELWSSPYVRAAQTANVLAQKIPDCPPVQFFDALRQNQDHMTLHRAISEHVSGVFRELKNFNGKVLQEGPPYYDICFVGHEPTLSLCVSMMLGLSRPYMGLGTIKMTKASVVQIIVSSTGSVHLASYVSCAMMKNLLSY